MNILLKYMKDEEELENNKSLDMRECLITGDLIKERDGVELACCHFFKYTSLVKEIQTNMNTKQICIRCPYCRQTQNSLLPYRKGMEKIKKVNYPLKYCYYKNKCTRVIQRGKRKGRMCGKACEFDLCLKCDEVKPAIAKIQCLYIKSDNQRCKMFVKSGEEHCHHHKCKEDKK